MGEQRVRIVAGELKGRTIAAPKGHSTRPTSDRAREGLFSALTARLGPDLDRGSVFDAYAGSGALGLEALSRGAARATFSERDPKALSALRANITGLGLTDRATVIPGDVRSLTRRAALPGSPYSLLFLDPPYRIDESEVRALVERLLEAGALTDGAFVIWEHDANTTVSWPAVIEPLFDLRYGSTRIDASVVVRGDAG